MGIDSVLEEEGGVSVDFERVSNVPSDFLSE